MMPRFAGFRPLFFSILLTWCGQWEVALSLILHYLQFVHLTTLLSLQNFHSPFWTWISPEADRSSSESCLISNCAIRSDIFNLAKSSISTRFYDRVWKIWKPTYGSFDFRLVWCLPISEYIRQVSFVSWCFWNSFYPSFSVLKKYCS